MHADLEKLVLLQRTDLEIVRATTEIAALPKQLALIEAKLTAARTSVAKADESLKVEELLRRRCESDIKDKQQKILKYRQQIDTVKTNDQFTALQHEVAFAEKEISRFEDAELESMERSEQLDAARKAAATELAEQTIVIEREKVRAKETTAVDEAELVRLRAERLSLRQQVSEETLATYDRVSKSRGTGVAEGLAQKCSACQMLVRPQKWNELRDGAMMTCDSCGRLLYYDHTGRFAGAAGTLQKLP